MCRVDSMKNNLLILGLLALILAYAAWQLEQPPRQELEAGFVALFDGKSLEGWNKIGGESSFHAERGEIVGTHGPGENTFLRTEKTYSDFILTLDMRWDELGNSGVLFRAGQREEDDRAFGYQYELDHSERSWSGGIYDEARRGWLNNLENNEAARNAIRYDDWNQVRIEARGASLKTWINGVPAGDIVDGLDAEGFIALQVHSGDMGIMRWRNIHIRELPPQSSGGGTELMSNRQYEDFIARFDLPVCEKPAVIRLRLSSDRPSGPEYAELKVDNRGARAAYAVEGDSETGDLLTLEESPMRSVVVTALGDGVTFTVDDRDVARYRDIGLPGRGQFEIASGDCGVEPAIVDFNWTNLKVRSAEVLPYETLDNAPAPVFTPEQSLADFRLAPGFEVELVAADPLVGDPVAMAWDEYGRLYVVEMRGYMPDAYGTGRDEPVGRVVRLEDRDGDGQMDTSEVFLDKLVNPRAVAAVNEGILVGEPPNLWLCELDRRDSLCDNRRSLVEYGVGDENTSVEHLENGLLQGLDNWLYNSKSGRRMRIVDGELEVEDRYFRGQWGISKDDQGRLFYNNNSNWVTADFFMAEDLVQGLAYEVLPGLKQVLNSSEEVFTVRVNPGVNRAYLDGTLREDGRLNKTTGVSGLVVYRGDQFPPGYKNHVFVPEPAGNVLGHFALAEHGIELSVEHQLYDDEQWGQREFLGATDERFRPVDVKNGPDGALYIIDMYRGIIQDQHFLTDELREQILQRGLDSPIGKGRIWRIRHTGGKQGRGFPPLANASAAELVQALNHANGWVRDTAQRLLLGKPGEGGVELQAALLGENSLAAIHAMWVLAGRDELQRQQARQVLAIDDSQRQWQMLRAGRDVLLLEDLQVYAASLHNLRNKIDSGLAMQLAFALDAHVGEESARALLMQLLVADLGDAFVRQAVVRAAQGRELLFLHELLADGHLQTETAGGVAVLADLSASAYRSLRGDLTSGEPASEVLLTLLALIEPEQGEKTWRQLALLDGVRRDVTSAGFRAALLAEAPPIFSDGSIDEDNPLWDARLSARKAFTWPGDELALGIKPLSPTQLALMEKGEAFYSACATCHGQNGGGTAGLAPALANSPWVVEAPERLQRIIMQGYDGDFNGIMPPHGHLPELDDETLAGLMIYLRRSWGNTANAVDVETVAEMRAASGSRDVPWTPTELEQVEIDLGYDRFVGKYKVSFITMTIYEENGLLMMKVPMYGGGALKPLSEYKFDGSAGSEKVQIEFIPEEDGSIQKFVLYREGQKITVKRG